MHSRTTERRDRRRTGDDEALQLIVAGVVMALVFLVAFGLLALDFQWFWVAFPVGFAGVLPAALGLTQLYQQRQRRRETERAQDAYVDDPSSSEDGALSVLRERFARGDIDEETYEKQVATLLETGTDDDARRYLTQKATEPDL